MKKTFFILCCLTLFFCAGYYLENSDQFSVTKTRLQDRSIPSPLLNFGKTGSILRQLGLNYVIPKEEESDFSVKTDLGETGKRFRINSSQLTFKKNWKTTGSMAAEEMPSSRVMNKQAISSGLSILSVVIDPVDLDDPETGIFKNYKRKGRVWERPCFISYYEKGNLLFASGSGVRVHGGKEAAGLRLYFRDIYGSDRFGQDILFNGRGDPVRHLVVHDETRGSSHYLNLLAFDIADKIGCITPYTKPIKVYLNGQEYGDILFALTEHLSREFLISRFGHENFIFVRSKGRKAEPEEFRNFKRWVSSKKIRMTMEDAQNRVDLKNFSLWWLSQIYCANTDAFQGLAVLDKSKPEGKWFWINWDMDHSFVNNYEKELEHDWEQKKTLHDVMAGRGKEFHRGVLLRRLVKEDPAYSKYFEKLFMDMLNHRLTMDFLQQRVDYYQKAVMDFGGKGDSIKPVREFIKNRHSYMRILMMKYFGSPESFYCTITGPEDLRFLIDGFERGVGYKGWYFKGTEISIQPVGKYKGKVARWLIDGTEVSAPGDVLSLQLKRSIKIEPVMAD